METRRVRWGLVGVTFLGVVVASALGLGCGSASDSKPGSQPASAGSTGSGGNGSGGGTGSCRGTSCPTGGGSSSSVDPAAAAKACRDYFKAVCTRIRECDAPRFRPCESPIDACPDTLFSDGSAWTVPQVVACTEEWKTHDCAALKADQGPACSQVPGTRPAGDQCVFDAQCQGSHCNGGISPSFQPSCGKCADQAPSHGVCDELHVCPSTESCEAGQCVDTPIGSGNSCTGMACPDGQTCYGGECAPVVQVGEACDGYRAVCAPGLGCQIDIVPEPEPEPLMGTCQPLPAIGTPCLPTFGYTGICEDGGTCTNRPTGNCVPLVEIGESCGFTQCVEGAYCQTVGYQSVPSHLCYALGKEGDACPHEGFDLGKAACVGSLDCLCATPDCGVAGTCLQGRAEGQSCGPSEQCKTGLGCQNAVCVNVNIDPNALAAGSACTRATAYGREDAGCATDYDCLCPDAACTAPICAKPRDLGDTCAAPGEICHQGLTCTAGTCVAIPDRNFESISCMPTAP